MDFLPKTVLSAALRFLISALFLISFISKIGGLEPVELSIVELKLANWTTVPIFSRFILGVELALAIAFFFNILRKWTFWGSQALLLVFSVFLVYTYAQYGNEGDCGCFGTFMQMSPLASLQKNLVMSGLIVAWYIFSVEKWTWKTNWVVAAFATVSLVLPYILDFPFFDERAQADLQVVNYPLDVETLGPMTFSDRTSPDFKKGEYLIAFLSLKCKHCINTAHRLSILQNQLQVPKVYAVYIGKAERLPVFEAYSRAKFPNYIYQDKKLMKVTGPEYPLVMHVQDGIVKHKWNFLDDKSFTEVFPNKK